MIVTDVHYYTRSVNLILINHRPFPTESTASRNVSVSRMPPRNRLNYVARGVTAVSTTGWLARALIFERLTKTTPDVFFNAEKARSAMSHRQLPRLFTFLPINFSPPETRQPLEEDATDCRGRNSKIGSLIIREIRPSLTPELDFSYNVEKFEKVALTDPLEARKFPSELKINFSFALENNLNVKLGSVLLRSLLNSWLTFTVSGDYWNALASCVRLSVLDYLRQPKAAPN
ncbi:hypothetical protein K0M31_003605 [Melipona bicolor]|uniref:Uncharacterized protein n=1 Tax=Melipona bicolor TaxID=60889 RepID=A0AA40FZY2_9HYME|nr:hypothetical protein K0M31_003605 [Melipona bicolor]